MLVELGVVVVKAQQAQSTDVCVFVVFVSVFFTGNKVISMKLARPLKFGHQMLQGGAQCTHRQNRLEETQIANVWLVIDKDALSRRNNQNLSTDLISYSDPKHHVHDSHQNIFYEYPLASGMLGGIASLVNHSKWYMKKRILQIFSGTESDVIYPMVIKLINTHKNIIQQGVT